jgi:hypothetical protein
MKHFAKLYETERGQIVAIRQANDEGYPEIRFFFRTSLPGLGVCSMAIGFKRYKNGGDEDLDGAYEKADEVFGALTEDGVRERVFLQIDAIEESFCGG